MASLLWSHGLLMLFLVVIFVGSLSFVPKVHTRVPSHRVQMSSRLFMNRGVKRNFELGLSDKGKFRKLRDALLNISYLGSSAQAKEMVCCS
jgi:hypothetical protein